MLLYLSNIASQQRKFGLYLSHATSQRVVIQYIKKIWFHALSLGGVLFCLRDMLHIQLFM